MNAIRFLPNGIQAVKARPADTVRTEVRRNYSLIVVQLLTT
jgi:hypothetical protein